MWQNQRIPHVFIYVFILNIPGKSFQYIVMYTFI
jgi:hypothetical protein